jgi:hypothetical protein
MAEPGRSAILAADVLGFSHHDQRLRAGSDLIDPTVATHNGRVFSAPAMARALGLTAWSTRCVAKLMVRRTFLPAAAWVRLTARVKALP